MKKSKSLWRALLFFIVIAALCGSFALPMVSVHVNAAPQLQATLCTGTTFAQWTFENVTTPFSGTGIFSQGSGLPASTFAAGNPGQSISYDNWTTSPSLDTNYYVQFAVPTIGRKSIHLDFGYRATGTGPQFLAVHYSIDNGANFSLLGSPIPLTRDSSFHSLSFDFSTVPALDDNANAIFRIYGYASTGTTGTLRLDNVAFSGTCVVPAPPDTAVPPRSLVINEIAWAGTVANSNDEWFELYNNTGADINLAGWRLVADDGNPDIALSGTITAADPHFVFAKSNSVFNDLVPDKTFSGSFSNSGETLYLLDPNGNQVDTANLDGGAWPAGSGSPDYASMERKGTAADSPSAWSTYGGTIPIAHDRNGNDIKGTPGQNNWVSSITPTSSPTSTGTPTATGTPGKSLSVLINEVAWSGTTASSSDEWIELYNPGASVVDITGWKLYGDDNVLNKIGSPNIPLKGTIPAKSYFLLERDELATDVPANQVYSSGDLLNTGERLYLKDNAGNTIDTANLDGGAWPAGTASTSTTSPPAYASMERVGTTGNLWVTYQGTVPVAYNRNNGPIKGTPGFANWINTASVTTITSDLPDPSLVNQLVTVKVTVIGGTTTPTGTVTVTGANQNCTITLSSGTGSCSVKFTSVGTKTIIATYHSTNGLPPSNDTESHVVSTSGTIYKTPTPIPPPPPQLVVINEFVPRPGSDWNHDGVVNVGDEYIELLNHGTVDVNLSGWRLDDEVNVGSDPFSLPAKTIKPGERIVFYGSDTGLLLGDGGDAVRLLKPNGQLIDAYNYTVARYPDESFCRLPDNGGADDWNQYCFPTPGIQNSLSGNFVSPSNNVNEQLSCPISDTLPQDFVQAECDPFGKNIWRPEFWDNTGWFDEKNLPAIDGKWPVFAD